MTPTLNETASFSKCNCTSMLAAQNQTCLYSESPCGVPQECKERMGAFYKCVMEEQKGSCKEFADELESDGGPWSSLDKLACVDGLIADYEASTEPAQGATQVDCYLR